MKKNGMKSISSKGTHSKHSSKERYRPADMSMNVFYGGQLDNTADDTDMRTSKSRLIASNSAHHNSSAKFHETDYNSRLRLN